MKTTSKIFHKQIMNIWERIQAMLLTCYIFSILFQDFSTSGKRYQHCGVVLGDGSVVVTGGQVSLKSFLIFNFLFSYGTSSHIANTMIRVQFDNFTTPAENLIICKVKILFEKPTVDLIIFKIILIYLLSVRTFEIQKIIRP